MNRSRSLVLVPVLLLAASAAAGTFTEPPPGATLVTATFVSPVAVAIPEQGVVSSPIEVSGVPGRVWDVNVVLNVAHEYPSDLALTLFAPSGRRVRLTVFLPSPLVGTTLDDEALLPAVIANGTLPDVQPDQALATLAGEDPNGTWRMECTDALVGFGGAFTWQLELATIGFEPLHRVQVASTAAGQTIGPVTAMSSFVNVPDPGFVCEVEVLVHVVHPDPSQLMLSLQGGGRDCTLALERGNDPQFYANATFDDDQDDLVRLAFEDLPLEAVSPVGSLAHMRGLDAAGSWQLIVYNESTTDSAVLLGWELRITTCDEPVPETFCFGSAPAPCPCGNHGASESGCRNATHAGGARLLANGPAGAPRVGDDVTLAASDLDPFQLVLFVQGAEAAGGGVGLPLGDGLLCVSGPIVRLALRYSGFGSTSYPGPFDLPLSRRGGVPPSGGTRVYQALYRSPLLFGPCHTGLNSTNGVRITWLPGES